MQETKKDRERDLMKIQRERKRDWKIAKQINFCQSCVRDGDRVRQRRRESERKSEKES